ncbi:RHS repeat-associated core domain-containing protein [Streptomyces bacillaris]|uniref:RHS repeat-associated core domain-containing protein n=1 Tax=Streptomyces bacillaris TaxID=68179 RepID=UPI00345FBE4C
MGGLVNETIVFRYNSDGLPISIGGTASYLNDVKYSAFGEVLRTDAGVAGRKVHGTYLYDEFTRRLTEAGFDRSVNPGHIGATQYAYDDAGNVTQIKDTPGAAAPDNGKTDTQCFVYNQLRQMTSAWTAKDDCQAPASKDTVGGPDPYWQTYAFDEAGNRKQLVEKDTTGDTTKDVTRTYTYGKPGIGGPNALAEIKSTGPGGDRLNTFGYDDAGNTTTRQHNGATQTLEWNVEGELASVSEPTEGGGVKKTSYLYGADGSRLIRAAADGSKTLYLGEAELKVSADGTTKTAERFYPHPDGSMTVRATGGGRQLMLSDHHGSSNTTVDLVSVGMPVTRRKLMPFGEQRGAQPSTWPGSRGLVGGTVDQDTGLTRLGARDYDPTIGRFLSIDPLVDYGEPATINPYAYSNNAPATFSDASGLFWPIVGRDRAPCGSDRSAQGRPATAGTGGAPQEDAAAGAEEGGGQEASRGRGPQACEGEGRTRGGEEARGGQTRRGQEGSTETGCGKARIATSVGGTGQDQVPACRGQARGGEAGGSTQGGGTAQAEPTAQEPAQAQAEAFPGEETGTEDRAQGGPGGKIRGQATSWGSCPTAGSRVERGAGRPRCRGPVRT